MGTIDQLFKTKWNEACFEGKEYTLKSNIKTPIELIKHLINSKEKEKLEWANWGLVRLMNKKQKVQYSIYAAKLTLYLFKNKFPNDDRPEKAIEAAEKYLKYQSQKK